MSGLFTAAFLRQIGWDPDEIVGKRLPDLMPDAQGEQLIAHQVAALRGEQRSFEYQSVRTGRDYWVRVVPITDDDGEVVAGMSISVDITDHGPGEPEFSGRSVDVEAVTEATRDHLFVQEAHRLREARHRQQAEPHLGAEFRDQQRRGHALAGHVAQDDPHAAARQRHEVVVVPAHGLRRAVVREELVPLHDR